nr:hypothetical protein [uncultured Capnocytophaga sp.]
MKTKTRKWITNTFFILTAVMYLYNNWSSLKEGFLEGLYSK